MLSLKTDVALADSPSHFEGMPYGIAVPSCKSSSGNSMPLGPMGLFDKAMELLQQHAADRTSLKEILASLQVPHYTLLRLFLARLGRTPGQELLRLRLERAKSLLVTTKLPINKIARLCGYQRASNFGDFIFRHTSLTPLAWRRRYSTNVPMVLQQSS